MQKLVVFLTLYTVVEIEIISKILYGTTLFGAPRTVTSCVLKLQVHPEHMMRLNV